MNKAKIRKAFIILYAALLAVALAYVLYFKAKIVLNIK